MDTCQSSFSRFETGACWAINAGWSFFGAGNPPSFFGRWWWVEEASICRNWCQWPIKWNRKSGHAADWNRLQAGQASVHICDVIDVMWCDDDCGWVVVVVMMLIWRAREISARSLVDRQMLMNERREWFSCVGAAGKGAELKFYRGETQIEFAARAVGFWLVNPYLAGFSGGNAEFRLHENQAWSWWIHLHASKKFILEWALWDFTMLYKVEMVQSYRMIQVHSSSVIWQTTSRSPNWLINLAKTRRRPFTLIPVGRPLHLSTATSCQITVIIIYRNRILNVAGHPGHRESKKKKNMTS